MMENKVIHGDCIEVMASQIDAGSVDLVITEAPFNNGFAYDECDDNKGHDEYIDWSRRYLAAAATVLRPGGVLWAEMSASYSNALLPFLLKARFGLQLRRLLIWNHYSDECSNADWVREFCEVPPVFLQFTKGERELGPGIGILVGMVAGVEVRYYAKPRLCGVQEQSEGWHGCQVPPELLRFLIESGSREGELVLDPFAGAGSILEMARDTGRRWLGIELSASYFESIQRKMQV